MRTTVSVLILKYHLVYDGALHHVNIKTRCNCTGNIAVLHAAINI